MGKNNGFVNNRITNFRIWIANSTNGGQPAKMKLILAKDKDEMQMTKHQA
jgi:hypothetical protein